MFSLLHDTDQEASLSHIASGERRAHAPQRLQNINPITIHSAIIVGGGKMEATIAYSLLAAGIEVIMLVMDAKSSARGYDNVEKMAAYDRINGSITDTQAEMRLANFRVTTEFSAASEADLAIVTAGNAGSSAQITLQALETAMPEHAILCITTSDLDVVEISRTMNNPCRLVGIHFPILGLSTELLEIFRHETTTDTVMATVFGLAKQLSKVPVISGDPCRSIADRILSRYYEAAEITMLVGSNPWEIDEAMVDFGFTMGPYETQDICGLDQIQSRQQRQATTRTPNRHYGLVSDRMVTEGRWGKKTSVGWYRYPGGGPKVIDPLVEDLVIEEARFAKIARCDFNNDAISQRLILAMINEAAKILAEGIAQSAIDIDLVTVSGLGFPRWRGGLFHFAEQVGMPSILAALQNLAIEDSVVWGPCDLIMEGARHGKTFSDYVSGHT